MRETADVVIVGGGPAGAVTALLLARAGVDVAVVERTSMPRRKACGECLSPHATDVLAELGLLDAVLAQRPARLRGWRILAPNGRHMAAEFPASSDGKATIALAIDRAALDATLLDAAAAAGARIIAPARVGNVLRTADRVVGVTAQRPDYRAITVGARLTIGADGLRSVVARAVGAPRRPPRLRKLSLTAHLPVAIATDALGELHLADGVCVGVAPITAGSAPRSNVTVVLTASARDRLRDLLAGAGRPATRAALLRTALRTVPAVHERCAAAPLAALTDAEVLASGPFDFPMRHVTGAGYALVGDAAGYYDPFTGQGICHAIVAARRLATAALEGLRDPRRESLALAGYAHAQRKDARATHGLQRCVETVVSRPWLADRILPALQRSARARTAIIAATGDLVPPNALLSPALLLTFFADSVLEGSA